MFSLFLTIVLSTGIGMWTLAIGSLFTLNKKGSKKFIRCICNSVLSLLFLWVAVTIMLLLETLGVTITL